MSRSEAVDLYATAAGVSKAKAKDAIALALKSIFEAAASDRVTFVGYGSFSIKNVPARKGTNPKNGKPLNIKARKRFVFKPSSKLFA